MKSNNLKRLPLALFLSMVLGGAAMAEPRTLDRIVAVVNNGVITQYELNAQLQRVTAQLARTNPTPAPHRVLEKQVLERMITEKALLQSAETSNIRIDNTALNRALTRLANQNNMDLPAFKQALENEGQDFAAFREQVRNEMTISRLREREVDARIIVTESELDNFLANPSVDMDHQTEYNLAHILILAPEGASPEKLHELQGKADKAPGRIAQRRQLQSGLGDLLGCTECHAGWLARLASGSQAAQSVRRRRQEAGSGREHSGTAQRQRFSHPPVARQARQRRCHRGKANPGSTHPDKDQRNRH
jgi:hypothetical protein